MHFQCLELEPGRYFNHQAIHMVRWNKNRCFFSLVLFESGKRCIEGRRWRHLSDATLEQLRIMAVIICLLKTKDVVITLPFLVGQVFTWYSHTFQNGARFGTFDRWIQSTTPSTSAVYRPASAFWIMMGFFSSTKWGREGKIPQQFNRTDAIKRPCCGFPWPTTATSAATTTTTGNHRLASFWFTSINNTINNSFQNSLKFHLITFYLWLNL